MISFNRTASTAVLICTGPPALVYAPVPAGGGGGIVPVHLLQSAEGAAGAEGAPPPALIVIDAAVLGSVAAGKALSDLEQQAAPALVVVWVKDERQARALDPAPGTLVVRGPSERERYAEIGRMVAALEAGGVDALLREIADRVFGE